MNGHAHDFDKDSDVQIRSIPIEKRSGHVWSPMSPSPALTKVKDDSHMIYMANTNEGLSRAI